MLSNSGVNFENNKFNLLTIYFTQLPDRFKISKPLSIITDSSRYERNA